MRIGFVAEPYEETHASGMGYVVLELMRQLVAHAGKHEIIFYSSKPISKAMVPGVYTNILISRSLVGKLWWALRLKDDLDALLFNVPLLPLIVLRHIKSVALCQEIRDQEMRSSGVRESFVTFVRDRILMPICLRRAARITAASYATKDELVSFYSLLPEAVTVIHDGFQDLSSIVPKRSVITPEMRSYFLFAGKVKSRKNVHGIVSGFILFKKRTGANCGLVIAGDYGGAYYRAMMDDLTRHGFEKSVFFPGYVKADALVALYQNALAFVFPSLHEGFGMPILEAMSLGTPVITSNISSMPEVADDAALLVNPHDPEDIALAMERIYADEKLRTSLIVKGRERAKLFSWQRAGEAYEALLTALFHEASETTR